MERSPQLDDRNHLEEWSNGLATEVDQLKLQLVEIQRKLAAAEERRNLVIRLLELEQEPSSVETRGAQDVVVTSSVSPALQYESSGLELEDAVTEILNDAGSPLHISLIREKLIANGVRIPGRGDDANIIVRLRKLEDRFTRTARGTYALSSWGLPSVDTARRSRPKKKVAKR